MLTTVTPDSPIRASKETSCQIKGPKPSSISSTDQPGPLLEQGTAACSTPLDFSDRTDHSIPSPIAPYSTASPSHFSNRKELTSPTPSSPQLPPATPQALLRSFSRLAPHSSSPLSTSPLSSSPQGDLQKTPIKTAYQNNKTRIIEQRYSLEKKDEKTPSFKSYLHSNSDGSPCSVYDATPRTSWTSPLRHVDGLAKLDSILEEGSTKPRRASSLPIASPTSERTLRRRPHPAFTPVDDEEDEDHLSITHEHSILDETPPSILHALIPESSEMKEETITSATPLLTLWKERILSSISTASIKPEHVQENYYALIRALHHDLTCFLSKNSQQLIETDSIRNQMHACRRDLATARSELQAIQKAYKQTQLELAQEKHAVDRFILLWNDRLKEEKALDFEIAALKTAQGQISETAPIISSNPPSNSGWLTAMLIMSLSLSVILVAVVLIILKEPDLASEWIKERLCTSYVHV